MPAVIAPRGTRDHLLDFGDHHNRQLVVSGALMEHWAAIVCAAAVRLVAGLLVLSAAIIGRFLLRAFPPPPEGISVDAVTRTGDQRITIASRTRDAT